MTEDDLRKKFEAMVSDPNYNFRQSSKGSYVNPIAARDWKWFVAGYAQATPPAVGTAQRVAGWKLVPVEPTPEMISASNAAIRWYEPDATSRASYSAMLAASPAASTQPQAPAQPAVARTDWLAVDMMAAAATTGDEGTITLAAQLAGAAPCAACGYVKKHCRCAPQPAVGGVYAALPGACAQLLDDGTWKRHAPDTLPAIGESYGWVRNVFTAAQMHAHADATAALRAGSEKDGARYRWLRDSAAAPSWYAARVDEGTSCETFDKLIDAARNKETP